MRRHLFTRVLGALVLGALVLGVLATAAPARDAAPPFTFAAPASLAAPRVSHAAIGTTYAYLAADTARPLRLTITVMPASEVEARVGRLGASACVNPFLAELEQTHERFFSAAQARPLVVAGHELPQFRWTGERRGETVTGIVACGRLGRAYYVIDFVDALSPSTASFPELRARLRELAPGRRPP